MTNPDVLNQFGAGNSVPSDGKKGNWPAKKYNFCNTQLWTLTEKFIWQIDNFRSRREENGECLESPFIPNGNELNWCLQIFPNGDDEEARGFVSVYLKLMNSKIKNGSIWAKFHVSIRGAKQHELIKMNDDFDKYDKKTSWGYPTMISRDRLLNDVNGLLHGDQLTIICEVTVQEESVKRTTLYDFEIPECRMVENMGHLFEESLFTDCQIIADDGKEFKVHKGILSCRSRYFAAMFKHGMEEAQNNTVRIKDIPSDVLGQMLRFIYSGTAPKLTEMAKDLLIAADKYGLDRLKVLCERELANALENGNACEMLIIAHKLSAAHLKSMAFNYIQMHADEVMETDGWKLLANGNDLGDLLKELMKFIIAASK